MDCLGPSLEDLFSLCGRFSEKTGALVAMQMIERLKFIHKRHFVHRDIKPDNFLIGATKLSSKIVYLIDFGLSLVYRDFASREHGPYEEGMDLIGIILRENQDGLVKL
jgi:serine/threonine protein kinase